MSTPHPRPHDLLEQHLAELKLTRIGETYRAVLDEAARQNSSPLDVLAALINAEVIARRERTVQNRIKQAKLPPRKTLEDYDFSFPKRIPKQKILRLFDCQFVEQHQSAVFIGPTGTGKTHLLNALAYSACEKGISVHFTRVIDMINNLTTAQLKGTLEKTRGTNSPAPARLASARQRWPCTPVRGSGRSENPARPSPSAAPTKAQRLRSCGRETTHAALLALALPNVLWVSFPRVEAPIPVWESESRQHRPHALLARGDSDRPSLAPGDRPTNASYPMPDNNTASHQLRRI